MVCRFTISLDHPPEELLERARKALAGAGGSLEGDSTGGTLRVPTPLGRIDGTYAVSGDQVRFDISKKPAFLSCAKIEAKLRELA